jgi:hypothetical protein
MSGIITPSALDCASFEPRVTGIPSAHPIVQLRSVEAVARTLNEAGVPYLVVGGLAVNAHGYGRATQDVDLVVRLDRETVMRLFGALATLGYRPRVPIAAADFADEGQRARWIAEKGMMVLNFHSDQHRQTPLDVFVRTPFDFDVEYREALILEIATGVPMRIARLGTLVQMKRDAGRPQDLADIAELESLGGAERDG